MSRNCFQINYIYKISFAFVIYLNYLTYIFYFSSAKYYLVYNELILFIS
jgi:hypothetical protein